MNQRKRQKKANRRVMRWFRQTSRKKVPLPSMRDCMLSELWQARRWE